jgi:hypothetical protein
LGFPAYERQQHVIPALLVRFIHDALCSRFLLLPLYLDRAATGFCGRMCRSGQPDPNRQRS